MVKIINQFNAARHRAMVDGMFRDRKRVFVDLLGWDVPTQGAYEKDQFDNEHAEYFIIGDPLTGTHHASMRLLRTDHPHLLDSVFPMLCDATIPRGSAYRELTRLCISPDIKPRERIAARNRLFTGLVQYALMKGIEGYTGVSEMHIYRQVLALGWRCTPLGLPRTIDGTVIAAVLAHVGTDTPRRFQEAGTWHDGEMFADAAIAHAA